MRERWGAAEVQMKFRLLPCAARFLTAHGPVLAHGPGVGDRWPEEQEDILLRTESRLLPYI